MDVDFEMERVDENEVAREELILPIESTSDETEMSGQSVLARDLVRLQKWAELIPHGRPHPHQLSPSRNQRPSRCPLPSCPLSFRSSEVQNYGSSVKCVDAYHAMHIALM